MADWSKILRYDLKQFLKHVLKQKQSINPRFSQRKFAEVLGVAPSTLNEILKGKRPLSKKTLEKLKKCFHSDKDFQAVIENGDKVDFKLFHPESPLLTKISTQWYHEALLELVRTDGFCEDYEWMADRLGISTEETTKVFNQLLEIGEIKRNQFGKLSVAVDNCLVVCDEERKKYLIKKNKSQLSKIESAMENLSSAERFYGTMTIAICPSDFDYMRIKLVEFIKEQQEFLSREGISKEEVYMLSVGFVPLTKKKITNDL